MIMDEPRERDRNGLQARASVSLGSGILNARDERVCRVHGDLLDWGTSEAGGNRRVV